MLFMVQDAQVHTYLEKPWKHLHCVTDLSLCANSKRPAVGVDPRASRYFFFVSRFSNDASTVVVLKQWSLYGAFVCFLNRL